MKTNARKETRPMKNHIGLIGRTALIAGLAFCLAAVSANAQAPGGGPGGRGGFGVLDDSQRNAYREALQKQSDEMQKLSEKLQAAQKELLKAVMAEKYDEKAVKEKAEAVAKIQTDISLLRCKAFASIVPTLKQEQKNQLLESRFAPMMLLGGFGGGFGGPGAPGGRGGGPNR